MTEKPILFSAPMVRAILEGRKTQTRRVMKPQPELNDAGLWVWPPYGTKVTKRTWRGFIQTDEASVREFFTKGSAKAAEALRYAPGDLLWVREAWALKGIWAGARGADLNNRFAQEEIIHRATADGYDETVQAWRPSIFMPRWASRITLRVTDVRVQRLQDISEWDAVAEGVPVNNAGEYLFPKDDFAAFWNTLNAERGCGWDTNPWVVAITFERVKP